jgi:Tol biopolymer transport system component
VLRLRLRLRLGLFLLGAATACAPAGKPAAAAASAVTAGSPSLLFPGEEKFLANIRQLTFGGQNAEAYWSADGQRIIFQSNDEGRLPCDQIFVINADGSGKTMVSNGKGKTTCSYFFPSGDRILYGSTFRAGEACPPPPDRSRGYVWALDDYDIYTARPDGSDIRALFSSPAYDAEATVSRDGKKIVFTSARDGDLEVYAMNADGSGVTRLTHTPGYDGGPFYSADGRKIVYRADHPKSPEDLALYRENLARGTYAPKGLEIRVMNADGSGDHAVTANGAANFAPYFFPDGKRIIFSSNVGDPKGRDFELFVINADGTNLTRVTFSPEFDGFPMFNAGGTKLVFASNRNGKQPRETNIFVADWIGK